MPQSRSGTTKTGVRDFGLGWRREAAPKASLRPASQLATGVSPGHVGDNSRYSQKLNLMSNINELYSGEGGIRTQGMAAATLGNVAVFQQLTDQRAKANRRRRKPCSNYPITLSLLRGGRQGTLFMYRTSHGDLTQAAFATLAAAKFLRQQ